LDRRGRLFALGQSGYRGASSETGARRNPRDKHDTSETFPVRERVREWSGKAKRMTFNLTSDVGALARDY